MQAGRGPTLEETLSFIRKAGSSADKEQAKKHLENLLYMKSVLYLDEKNNDKHISRVNTVLDAVKKEYEKELTEAGHAEGNIYLVANILAANKIIDLGVSRLKNVIDRVGPAATSNDHRAAAASVPVGAKAQDIKQSILENESHSQEMKAVPKLRETLGFLLSIIGDPLRVTNQIPSHLNNLEKISKLIKRKYQDPKIQKLNENIMGILSKIYGSNNEKELSKLLDNSIKILKNISQYKILITEFETTLKGFIVTPGPSEAGADVPYFLKQPKDQADKFYKSFKEERNVIKKIGLLETVLTSPVYKYNKELNAASLKLLRGLERMGLQVAVPLFSPEKNNSQP